MAILYKEKALGRFQSSKTSCAKSTHKKEKDKNLMVTK